MASLPRTFDEHPLTWLASESTSGPGPRIFESLPPSAKRAIHEAYKRYVHDLEVVKTALKSSTETATIDNHDFLWAWLCVNTRCIHYSLNNADRTRSLKDIDLTLCPIIDFANHTIKEELTAQVIRNGNSALEFFSAGTAMKKGDEIFLRYGNHNNAVLLAEYGFTISRSEQPSKLAVGENDTVDGGEINVDDVIEMLFEEKSGQWRKDILKSRGYWGDWTLHSSPTPAHPSYRILPALRLLHLSQPTPDEEAVLGSWTDAASNLNAWEMMVLGRQQTVSHQNELSVSGTMRVVCERVMARGEHGLNELYELEQSILTLTPEASGDTDWFSSTIRCATILWKEEYEVANAVLESIERGDPLE
ncbi:hypothetical protein FRB95_010755 [Tulasnella sp. JGI-2019a]|nr:hypothetical protein FRB93_004365 [Tulasnella sp. JGI-2019a]KAG9039466.1 hypothetical protein FRB95_010755 [Tulasnella sp. JGI-2019a]